jgi:hypothetical protein
MLRAGSLAGGLYLEVTLRDEEGMAEVIAGLDGMAAAQRWLQMVSRAVVESGAVSGEGKRKATLARVLFL